MVCLLGVFSRPIIVTANFELSFIPPSIFSFLSFLSFFFFVSVLFLFGIGWVSSAASLLGPGLSVHNSVFAASWNPNTKAHCFDGLIILTSSSLGLSSSRPWCQATSRSLEHAFRSLKRVAVGLSRLRCPSCSTRTRSRSRKSRHVV